VISPRNVRRCIRQSPTRVTELAFTATVCPGWIVNDAVSSVDREAILSSDFASSEAWLNACTMYLRI
jgi:hypothetical protein